MAGVIDYSKTPASNIAINAINIQGTASPANFDNALRQLMADIATAREDGSLASMPYATKSSGYTLALTDRGKLIECTAAVEIELLAAASATGFYFIAKANGGAVTLDPNSTEEINGSATSLVVADGTSAIVQCNGTAWRAVVIGQGDVTQTGTQTLTNKTLTSPVLTAPQINDTTADHQYVFAVSELAADRTVTLPLLTGADEFVFKDHAQTLTNKTLTAAVLGGTTNVSGGQLAFPASQSASADANTLDDYEEGTWTPVVAGSSVAGSGSYSTQTGHYTKIGNFVCIMFQVTYTGHTGTGNINITGFPFNPVITVPLDVNFEDLTFSGTISGRLSASGVFELRSTTTGSGGSSVAMDAAATIRCAGVYVV